MECEQKAQNSGSPAGCQNLCRSAVWLDLEVSQRGRLLKIGAICGECTLARSGSFSLPLALEELSGLAREAQCLLGHNPVRHDLAVLREIAPGHPVLSLPVIDTLILSPICFPENPYHRLVKDYKLVKESLNDPIADARQAAALFQDEFFALAGLRETEPKVFEALELLLTMPDQPGEPLAEGMKLVFRALELKSKVQSPIEVPSSKFQVPSSDRAMSSVARPETGTGDAPRTTQHGPSSTLHAPRSTVDLSRLFARWACASTPLDDRLLQTAGNRLALA